MQRELDQRLKAMAKEKVMDLLIEKHDFPVPQAMIESEATRLREETSQKMEGQKSTFELPLDIFKEQGERRVKLGMLIAEIIEHNNIEIDDALLRETIESFASTYDSPQEVVDWYFADPERLKPVRNVVLEDQVVDWVLGQVNVTDKPMSFSEVS
jgi:trigger factor